MSETSYYLRNHRAFLMGLAMISVMLYHQRWFSEGLFDFFHHVGLLGVDVFLFISGWGIYQSLSHNSVKQYYVNRFLRIVPTCVLIGCMEVAFRKLGVDSGSDTMMVNLLTMIGLFKWYIYAIICYYLLAPLLFRYVTTNRSMGCLVSSIILASFGVGSLGIEFSGSSVFVTTLPIILYRASGFLLGFWFAQRESSIPKWFISFSIVALLAVVSIYFIGSNQWYTNIISFSMAPFTLPIVVKGIHYVLPLFHNIGLYSVISSIGVMSLDYYLWHEYLFIGWRNCSCFESLMLNCLAALITTVLLANLTHYLTERLRKHF